MFGLIRKKRIIEIVKPLAKEYNDPVLSGTTEKAREHEFWYKNGNCNAINAIMHRLGIKFDEYTEVH